MKDIKRWVAASVPRPVDVVLGDFIHMISMTDKAPYAMFVAAMHRPVTSNAINASNEFDDEVSDNENELGKNMQKLVGNKRGITGGVKEKVKPKIGINKRKNRSGKIDNASKDVQDIPQPKDKIDSKWTKKKQKTTSLPYELNNTVGSANLG